MLFVVLICRSGVFELNAAVDDLVFNFLMRHEASFASAHYEQTGYIVKGWR